jgi:hypothetical protein
VLNVATRLGLIGTGVSLVGRVPNPYGWIPIVVLVVALLIDLPLAAQDRRAGREKTASASS